MHVDLTQAIEADSQRIREELEQLIRIPSVSAAGYPTGEVRRSAEFIASLMKSSGMTDVKLLEIDGAHPAVYGEKIGAPGSPTVLLYAHHDVQPPGPEAEWETTPFEPHEFDGRLFGRGSADDKAGVVLHLASIRALGDIPDVNVKLFVEGEEEVGSANLPAFLDKYSALLASDVIIIGDAANWRAGTPTFTTSLRGLVDCTVTIRTLRHAVHSGMFGGIYPDANIVLARVLSSLHNDDGSVAVDGLLASDADPLDLTEGELAEQMLPVDGLELAGTGSLTSRLWFKPSISVLAIDTVPVGEAINQIVPTASAKVSMRFSPGEDPSRAMDALTAHLEAAVPWGAAIDIERGATGAGAALDTSGPVYAAYREGMRIGYGSDPVEAGVGGSIPFVAAFSDAYPDAAMILIGVADPTSKIHGLNESVDLSDISSGAVAQAIALRLMGT